MAQSPSKSSALQFSHLLLPEWRKRAVHKPQIRISSGGWQHFKCGLEFGTPSLGGHTDMASVLRGAQAVSKELMGKHGLAAPLRIAAHFCHELAIDRSVPEIGATMSAWNNPRAISIDEWRRGVKSGEFAEIGNMVPGNFGFPGSRAGGLTNDDPEVRARAAAAIMHAFRLAHEHRTNKLGSGRVIYWDGEDQLKALLYRLGHDLILSYQLNPTYEDWRRVVEGLAAVVKAAIAAGLNPELLFENKGSGDPGATSQFTDSRLCIMAINQINQLAGCADDPRVESQSELLHVRLTGEPAARALEREILHGVWKGRYHFNSGKLSNSNHALMLQVGTPMSLFHSQLDPDYLAGEGPAECVHDQLEVLAIAALWSAITGMPFYCEFDAKFSRDPDVDASFLKSSVWVLENFRDQAAMLVLPE